MQVARACFDEIDEDDSGQLDKFELRALCSRLGMALNVRQVNEAWRWMDPDGVCCSLVSLLLP